MIPRIPPWLALGVIVTLREAPGPKHRFRVSEIMLAEDPRVGTDKSSVSFYACKTGIPLSLSLSGFIELYIPPYHVPATRYERDEVV